MTSPRPPPIQHIRRYCQKNLILYKEDAALTNQQFVGVAALYLGIQFLSGHRMNFRSCTPTLLPLPGRKEIYSSCTPNTSRHLGVCKIPSKKVPLFSANCGIEINNYYLYAHFFIYSTKIIGCSYLKFPHTPNKKYSWVSHT